MVAVGHLDMSHLLRRSAIIVHMAHKRWGEFLSRALPAVTAFMQKFVDHGGRGAGASAANAGLTVSVHRAEYGHGLAHACLNHAHSDTDQRLGRRPTAIYVHEKIQADTQIGGDKCGQGRIATRVAQHAIHLTRIQARINHGIAYGGDRHGSGCGVGTAQILGLAYTNDGVFFPQRCTQFRIQLINLRHMRSSLVVFYCYCRPPCRIRLRTKSYRKQNHQEADTA